MWFSVSSLSSGSLQVVTCSGSSKESPFVAYCDGSLRNKRGSYFGNQRDLIEASGEYIGKLVLAQYKVQGG